MYINVKIPTNKLKSIAGITKAALDYCREVDDIISALPKVDKNMDGQRAVDVQEAKIADYNLKKTVMLKTTKEKIGPMIRDVIVSIDAQTTPSGDMIAQNPDFLLFDHNLIKSPEQLERLVNKHVNEPHGIIFAMSAEDYAKSRNWGADFDLYTDEGAVRDFIEQVAEICQNALEFPGGYYDVYVSDDEFIEKVAAAHGILKSYATQSGAFPEPDPEPDPEPSGDEGGGDNGGGDEGGAE